MAHAHPCNTLMQHLVVVYHHLHGLSVRHARCIKAIHAIMCYAKTRAGLEHAAVVHWSRHIAGVNCCAGGGQGREEVKGEKEVLERAPVGCAISILGAGALPPPLLGCLPVPTRLCSPSLFLMNHPALPPHPSSFQRKSSLVLVQSQLQDWLQARGRFVQAHKLPENMKGMMSQVRGVGGAV